MKQPDLRDMFQKASNIACISTAVGSPHLLSDPDDTEPANEGDIHMEYSLISCAGQAKYKSKNKQLTTCKILGQFRYRLIIWYLCSTVGAG
jgi:hypothetical protein